MPQNDAYLLNYGSGQEVENQLIFASSAQPRTVGSEPEVEKRMIFASSVHPRIVEWPQTSRKTPFEATQPLRF